MSSTTDKTSKAQTPSTAPEREAEGEREDAFLRRWSRRKHEARTQEVAATVDSQKPQAMPPAEAASAPVKVLTDADMPAIESLNEESDFGMFLSSGVSEALRSQALRKLFLLPSINQRCPLDSEWFDCRNDEPLGNIITHDMREEMAREAQKLKDAALNALSEEKQPAEPVATAAYGIATPPSEPAPTATVDGQSDSVNEDSAT